jgi:hypothetical protein
VVNVWLTAGGREIVRWRSSTAVAGARLAGARLAVAGELAAADALSAAPEWLEVADIICAGRTRPLSWLTGILDSYPGCAVAAAPARGGRYTVATRGDRPFILHLLTPNDPGLRVPPDPRGSGALACAVFVHGWLAAGWPLGALRSDGAELVQAELVQAELVQAELVQAEPVQAEPVQAEPVRLEAGAGWPYAAGALTAGPARPVSFAMYYSEPVFGVKSVPEVAGSGPVAGSGARSASRRWTSAASGASMAE